MRIARTILVAIIASLLCVQGVQASLSFVGGAVTDNVNFGSKVNIDNFQANTLLVWVRPSAMNANRYIAVKETNSGTFQKEWSMKATGAWDFIGNTSGTTVSVRATTVNLNTVANEWVYIAFTVSAGLVPRVYTGTLLVSAIEGGYSIQTTGTGTLDAEGSDSFVLGNNVGLTLSWPGQIGFVSYWNRELTLGEIRTQQFRPRCESGCRILAFPGFNGTTNVPDYSGNLNTGTITGATLTAVGLPIPFLSGFDALDGNYVPSGAITKNRRLITALGTEF